MKLSYLTSIGLAVFLSACVTGPESVAPELPTPDNFENSLTLNQTGTPDMPWWEGFSDPILSNLIKIGLDRNLDIDVAIANLARTRAVARAFKSDLFPTFDAFVDTQMSSILTGGVEADLSTTVGGAFAFSPDITGRNRRALQGADARFRAAAFDLADIRRLTASAIAQQYILLRRSGAAIVLQDTSLELQRRTVEITTARFNAGISPALDVDRATADLARTMAQSSLLVAERRNAEYALSVLTGKTPESGLLGLAEDDIIPTYENGYALGLPADLLRQRPDIRAAELNLIAEIADIGVQEADLYPSLNLPGTISAGRTTADNGLNAVTLGIAALLDIPLFDAGRREAEVDIERAEAEAALALYKSSLLDAIGETETALVRIEALKEQKQELEKAVQSNESAFNQLNALYREGLADFINVLDSQRSLISSREAIVTVNANLALAHANLQTALGRR